MTWAPILWILSFLPALVALYFLKLRRKSIVTSSTLLWKRSLEDVRANAPFQKLRRSWLLLLQLLVLTGLILAAWQPRLSSTGVGGRSLIVLVDTSASTAAREKEGIRLDLMKEEALRLVDGLGSSDRMALLSFSSRATLLEPLTNDKAALRDAIRAMDGTALPTRIDQALLVAQSMAEAIEDCEVHVLGDGCYGDLSTLPAEVKRLKMTFVSRGTSLENVGITELDVRRSFEGAGRTEVFALIENFGKSSARRVVSFTVAGELKDAREIDIAPSGSAPVVFDATLVGSGAAMVSIDGADALEIDDKAWVLLAPRRVYSVLLVGEPNPWVELALGSSVGISHRRMDESAFLELQRSRSGTELEESLAADVLVFDRCSFTSPENASPAAPPLLPAVPALFIACQPPGSPPWEAETRKMPIIVDWDRAHPVNRFLAFADLRIEESLVFRAGTTHHSLVDSDVGCIIGTIRTHSPGRAQLSSILMGFDILKSNWPLGHYSFPIFFSNAIAWLGDSSGGERAARYHAGEPLVHHPERGRSLDGSVEASFVAPSGKVLPAAREEGGALVLGSADEIGVYEARAGDEVLAKFPVALLRSAESRLEPSSSIEFGDYSMEVRASIKPQARDLWKWFALAALAFLLVEWCVYHRRIA
ncbi:MAG TPA: VWA domain-containing protein [Planctomycetota bacterium]|nr:VWA domain-containing protein [Planctomycetota bacterium]